MELKTKKFKDAPIKNYEREKHILYIFLNLLITPEKLLLYKIVFKNLKWKFVNAPVLIFLILINYLFSTLTIVRNADIKLHYVK
jgi:hypothetical protein